MLRVHLSASAAQAKQYYAQGLSVADYYRQDDGPGLWHGLAAERLGLTGEVGREEFYALLENRHPATGDKLSVRDKGEARRPGWDLVFSPAKGVSVLRALTGDDRIRAAMIGAVQDTLAEIESDAVRTRLRRGGGQGSAATGNLVASLFYHDTTRELADGRPDPHDHVHVFVHNVTWAEHEDRFQAIDAHDLHRDRPYYEAAFDSRLAARLAGMGYPVERRADGWDVALPPGVAAKFSRRTAEIEGEAERRGVTDAAAKGRLGAATRRKKGRPLPAAELAKYWAGKLTPAESNAVAAAFDRSLRFPLENAPGPTAARALAHAADHHFAGESVVSLKRLQTTALKFGVGTVTPEAVRAQVGRQGLLTAERGGQLLATSSEVRTEEQAMLRFAREGRGTCDPLGGWKPRPLSRDFLNAGQKGAVTAILASFDRLQILAGKAGVGKSTLLAEIREAVEAAGRPVVAVAPTTGAVAVLRRDGFPAETVAMLLASTPAQEKLRGALLVVDEAGLVGSRTMARLLALADRHDARVLLSGDAGQHRSPERGTALRLLQERGGIKPAGVSEIVRQAGRLKEAVAALAGGRGEEGFDRLDGLGFVHEVAGGDERYRRLAGDYADALTRGKEALAISPTHAEAAAVTAAIREELRARGRLGRDERIMTRLEPANLSEAERKDAVRYEAGDVVQFHQNAAGGWRRGERASVVSRDENSVTVIRAAGEEATLPLAQAARFQLYRPRPLAVAAGDRVRFTVNGYTPGKKRLDSGMVAVVAGFTPRGDLRLDNGWVVPQDYGHLAPGWVVTSHAAQGRTVDGTVFVAQSAASLPATSLEQFYVSVSRAKGAAGVAVYTDDKPALRRAVARSERPLSASELLDPRPVRSSPWAAAVARLRRARHRLEVYARRGFDAAGDRLAHHTPPARRQELSHER